MMTKRTDSTAGPLIGTPNARIEVGRTAIGRPRTSRPISAALDSGVLTHGLSVLDYGCGRGDDVRVLRHLGFQAWGWDPVHNPDGNRLQADVVNLGYVINVIPDPLVRAEALSNAWGLAKRALIVAARLEGEAEDLSVSPCGDGVLTSRRTFQKFYMQDELRRWINDTLGIECVAAAPGIFYVFRNAEDAQAHLASQFRTRTRARDFSPEIFAANQDVLGPLSDFVIDRGRLPFEGERPWVSEIRHRFGSIQAAFALARRIVGGQRWDDAVRVRYRDYLVYLALSAFRRRPRLRDLPPDLQEDIKGFFGSYRAGCDLADALLYSTGNKAAIDAECESATVGKLTPDALYVHISALGELPPLLRVYEGCARMLTGEVPDATLVKLKRGRPKVSYLVYPTFDSSPHPELHVSYVADLARLDSYAKDYRQYSNPPVLHRKETFVGLDYPGREKFRRLTIQEERAGLLSSTESIGTRNGWRAALDARGVSVRGHRLFRRTRPS